MSTPLRVAAFLLGVVAVFALALGVGRWVGPLDVEPVAHAEEPHGVDDAGDASDGTPPAATRGGTDDVSALTARADGFALRLADRTARAGRGVPLAFTVETSSGQPLLDYDTVHEKDLHLIVVRRDLTGFQHLHPTLDAATGTWSTDVDLTPGTWRVVADFAPAGWDGVTLADDLAVPGRFSPTGTGGERLTDTVDGYEVTLAGDTAPGADTTLALSIEHDGEPVDDLEPYLGASGHLVALREGDLGYLHVHPEDGPPGPEVEFATAFPTAGTYRLFLDFKHGGRVRTADFTVVAGGAPADPGQTDDQHAEEDHHGH